MKMSDFVEKRRSRRLNLSLPMVLRRLTGEGKEEVVEAVTSNVSYDGVCISDVDLKDIKPNDNLQITLSVPRDDSRDFPFSRIIGKARVVRAGMETYALEFSEDVSRLCIAN
ncbi:MAG: PilZ domain-containing protein [Candidatus Omnitrophota bacterium]|nr:PilZ domain-containing protein [Candidatus Omnitrophota bacterium]